jgi:hypothetical protein
MKTLSSAVFLPIIFAFRVSLILILFWCLSSFLAAGLGKRMCKLLGAHLEFGSLFFEQRKGCSLAVVADFDELTILNAKITE